MMTWQKKEEGWTKRVNALLGAINSNVDVEKMKEAVDPPMDDEEIEWYVNCRKKLDEENERIRVMCEKEGIKPWRTGYGMVENEW